MALGTIPTGWVHTWLKPLYTWLSALKVVVDSLTGASWAPVRLLTAAALPANTWNLAAQTKTMNATGTLTVDGVLTALGDRIWDKDDVTGLQRGLFTVTTAGAIGVAAVLTRATDADTSAEFVDGKTFTIGEGTAAGETRQFTTNAPFVLNTDTPAIAIPADMATLATTQTFTGAKSFATTMLRVFNAGATFAHRFVSSATATRTVTLPDADFTPAQSTVATAAGGTGATGSGTASVSAALADRRVRSYVNAPASGTLLFAQQNTDFDIAQAAITQTTFGRTLQVVFSADWDGGGIEVTGIRATGELGSETVASAPGTTVQTTHAYLTGGVTRVRNLGTRTAGTVDVQGGTKLAVEIGLRTATLIHAFDQAAGAVAGATMSANGVLDLNASPPDGTRDYLVIYEVSTTFTDAGHTHTGPSHTHAQS